MNNKHLITRNTLFFPTRHTLINAPPSINPNTYLRRTIYNNPYNNNNTRLSFIENIAHGSCSTCK